MNVHAGHAGFLSEVNDFFNDAGYPRMNIKVKDFMRPDPLVLKPDANLGDAIKALAENQTDVVPIVDDDGGVIGVVTRKMALREINRSVSFHTKICDVMKKNPAVTTPDQDSLPLLKIPIGSIPVVDHGRIAGIVSLPDTVRACFSSVLMLHDELKTVIHSAHNGIITVDTDARIRLINSAAKKIMDINPEVIGQPIPNISMALKMKEVMDTGITVSGEKLFVHNKVLVINISRLNHKNKVIGAVAVIQDISDFENISEELKYTKELKGEMDTILESSFDGIYLTDHHGRILRANDAFVRITGIKKEELVDKTQKELVDSGIFKQDIPMEDILRGTPITIAQEVKSGKTILVTSNPIADHRGHIVRIVHNVRDITELNNLKNQLEKVTIESRHYKEQLKIIKTSNKYIAKAQKSKDLVKLVMNLSKIDATVLLLGESGVGKDVVAEILHENSPRKDRPMISINCAAIPENLIESELFGYEPGTFTGANKKGKIGAFETANGGTLFLDEIGEMPLTLQAKLLRAIQKREITKLGSNRPVKIDVRIIAATNRDLWDMVTKNLFRKDLFYRLNVVPITIPALRERKEEIPDLVFHFTRLFNKKYDLNKRFDEKNLSGIVEI